MRQKGKTEQSAVELRCNQCGRQLKQENGTMIEDALVVEKAWGYFSEKDLEVDRFILCEACYDCLLRGFVVPVRRTERTEAM